MGCQLTLGSIISFQGEPTTFNFYRFYLPNLTWPIHDSFHISSSRRDSSNFSLLRLDSQSAFPWVIFRMHHPPPLPPPWCFRWSSPGKRKGSGRGKGKSSTMTSLTWCPTWPVQLDFIALLYHWIYDFFSLFGFNSLNICFWFVISPHQFKHGRLLVFSIKDFRPQKHVDHKWVCVQLQLRCFVL